MEDREMKLEIIDDGNGTIALTKECTKTFGLQNIVSRLRYINGSMSRTLRKHRGTTVEICKSLK